MSLFQSGRPNFEAKSKEELIAILDSIRSSLAGCEDAGDFCLTVGEKLNVSCEAGYYDGDSDDD